MKKLLAFLSVILLLVCVGCNSGKQDSSSPKDSTHMNVIEGKIIEIKDDNTILLEIKKERGGYKIGDKVLIHYKEFGFDNGQVTDNNQNIIIPSLQDEVGTQFPPNDDIKQKDGYDYIEVLKVYKPIKK